MILREDPSDVSNSTELEMLCTGGSQKTPSRGNISWGRTINMFKIALGWIFCVEVGLKRLHHTESCQTGSAGTLQGVI